MKYYPMSAQLHPFAVCGSTWADLFESQTIILFKLLMKMSSHYVASASVSILNEDLTSDEIKLNFTPGPFLIISFKFNGVHTAVPTLSKYCYRQGLKSTYTLSKTVTV